MRSSPTPNAARRIYLNEQRERTIEQRRQARALIGSTDALERFDAWRAPVKRENGFDVSQLMNQIDLGVSVEA